MAKITWLGEDEGGVAGPSFTTCYGLKFPKGEAVEVTYPDTIARARKNQFFDVAEEAEPETDPEPDVSDDPAPPKKRGRPTNAERAAREAQE